MRALRWPRCSSLRRQSDSCASGSTKQAFAQLPKAAIQQGRSTIWKGVARPPPPPPLPYRPRLDFGRRVRRHAHPVDPACSGVHFRSVLRYASGFFSTRPRGARIVTVSRRAALRAVSSDSWLLPTRPTKDSHLQSIAHARHTYALPAFQPLQHPNLDQRAETSETQQSGTSAGVIIGRETGSLLDAI